MSIEIWQFPKFATKDQLTDLLTDLDFEFGDNLFWPGPTGTVSLFWAEPKDYISTSGVDASIFPLDQKGKAAWKTTNDLALRTRTSIWASSFDQAHQNLVVRLVRKQFGGRFYNDHYGHNRYIKIEKHESTAASRGIYALMTRLLGELKSLEYALPEEKSKGLMTDNGFVPYKKDDTGVLALTKQLDPSRVVYNALVPFLVAALEHLFRGTFEILLKYHDEAQIILDGQNRKVSYAEAHQIADGTLPIERVVSNWYSFQNVDSIHKAFREIHSIDIWKMLRRRKKVRDRLPVLISALQNLIGARHGVVHHFSIDRSLDREGYISLIHLTHAIIDVFKSEIERKLSVQLGPG